DVDAAVRDHHHAVLGMEGDARRLAAEHDAAHAGVAVLEGEVDVSGAGQAQVAELALDQHVLQFGHAADGAAHQQGEVGDAEDAGALFHHAHTRSVAMRPRTPLTKRPASSPAYALASSTASSMATLSGVSDRNSNSYAPSRSTAR